MISQSAIDHIYPPEEEVLVVETDNYACSCRLMSKIWLKARACWAWCSASRIALSYPHQEVILWTSYFPELSMTIVAIVRGTSVIVPRDGKDELEVGDKVYFVCDSEHTSLYGSLWSY